MIITAKKQTSKHWALTLTVTRTMHTLHARLCKGLKMKGLNNQRSQHPWMILLDTCVIFSGILPRIAIGEGIQNRRIGGGEGRGCVNLHQGVPKFHGGGRSTRIPSRGGYPLPLKTSNFEN